MENNPKYQNLYPIVNAALGKNYYLFCQTKQLNKNLLLLRKMSHLVLLGIFNNTFKNLKKNSNYLKYIGGLVQGELMTKTNVLAYNQMSDLDTQRAQLVATLNHQLSLLSNNLTSSTRSLAQALEQHSKSTE